MGTAIKSIAQLNKGDIVQFWGAEFEVIQSARESQSHRPQCAHITTAPGPTNCAVVEAVCVGGTPTPGYFDVGSPWTFQGTVGGLFAVSHQVRV
jgi:hypothetical protein